MVSILDNDVDIMKNLVFNDATNFYVFGTVARHNFRYWADKNSYFIMTKSLDNPKISVWLDVWYGGLLRLFVFYA